MTTRKQLLVEIQAALVQARTSRIEQSKLHDLFEAYVLVGLVGAARDEGWTVSLLDMWEQPASEALFRKSPGNIYETPGSQNFTHFVFEKSGVPTLEAHIGIKVTGKSDIEHECDVALLPQDTARSCRLHRVHPRSTRLLFAAECKFLTSRVPLHYGRGFVGLATELSSRYGKCHFVVNTTSRSVMKMLSRQKRECHEGVRPGARSIETFRSACRLTLQQYFLRERT